jgi:hypothetical protein
LLTWLDQFECSVKSGTCAEPPGTPRLGSAGRRRLVEIELATIQSGQVRQAMVKRVEDDPICAFSSSTRGEVIDLAVDLAARGLDFFAPLLASAWRKLCGPAPSRRAGSDRAANQAGAWPQPAARAAKASSVRGWLRSIWRARPVRPENDPRYAHHPQRWRTP